MAVPLRRTSALKIGEIASGILRHIQKKTALWAPCDNMSSEDGLREPESDET